MKLLQHLSILILFVISAHAAVVIPKTSRGGLTGAGGEVVPFKKTDLSRAASVGGEVTGGRHMEAFASVGPWGEIGRGEHLSNVVNLVNTTGTLPNGILREMFSPEDLVDGKTIFKTLRISAGTNETIALANVRYIVTSSDVLGDARNLLGETNAFTAGNTYSDSALLIQNDGSVLRSGTASTAGKVILIPIGIKHFTSPLKDVRPYTDAFPYWKITTQVWVGDAFMGTVALYKAQGPLRLVPTGGNELAITALASNEFKDPYNYPIRWTSALGTGVWASAGTIRVGETNVIALGEGMKFFQYSPPSQ